MQSVWFYQLSTSRISYVVLWAQALQVSIIVSFQSTQIAKLALVFSVVQSKIRAMFAHVAFRDMSHALCAYLLALDTPQKPSQAYIILPTHLSPPSPPLFFPSLPLSSLLLLLPPHCRSPPQTPCHTPLPLSSLSSSSSTACQGASPSPYFFVFSVCFMLFVCRISD